MTHLLEYLIQLTGNIGVLSATDAYFPKSGGNITGAIGANNGTAVLSGYTDANNTLAQLQAIKDGNNASLLQIERPLNNTTNPVVGFYQKKNGGNFERIGSMLHTGNMSLITPADIGAPTVTEFNSLKTSVSEGKALVAAAVTDKGVSTAADASFSTMAGNIMNIPSGSKVAIGTVYPRSTPFDISCGFKPSKLMFFICPEPNSTSSTLYQYAGSNLLLTCYWDGSYTIGLYIAGGSSTGSASYYFYQYNSSVTISANSTGCIVDSDRGYGPWPYYGNGTPYQWIAWT